MRAVRLFDRPIITPHMDDRIGENINGPSLVRVPDWVENPLGRYYLYFAHHRGKYIRLAYADALAGPWHPYEPGTLPLEESFYSGHVASPDVHVDDARREIRMYYHGHTPREPQTSRVALSTDGIRFTARPEILGPSYFRVWRSDSWWYAIGMPGRLFRSRDGLTDFEEGPTLFTPDMRHTAVLVRGHTLHVFYSNVGDAPERILHSTIDLRRDWRDWTATPPETVLAPERDYEGADLPLEPSVRGWAPRRVRQLRDPAIFCEGEDVYLLYSVAGEHGIAIARLELDGA